VGRSALRVLIVAVPPMRTLDVFGPAEVFGDANWLRGRNPACKVNIISACADRVVANHLGTPVHTDRTYREYRGPIDTLLVAGCMGPRELRYEPGFLDWLRLQSTRARRFGSICTGAFVLAKAGLLDGRINGPAFPNKPQIKIQNARCVSQRSHNFPFDRNPMVVNLIVERLTERNNIPKVLVPSLGILVFWAAPELHLIQKVKTRPVNQVTGGRLILGAEKNDGCKDALKRVDEAPIVVSIRAKAEESQQL
jgi:putative intracellular protease/amidase